MNKFLFGMCAFVSASLVNGVAVAGVLEDIGQSAARVAMQGQKSPTLYLAPGIKINIDGTAGGKVVKVFGDDQCPKDWMDNIQGSSAMTGCVALDKPKVTVHFEHMTEQWSVKTEGGRISLIRPNGVLVSQGK